jgi:hypothetical protein
MKRYNLILICLIILSFPAQSQVTLVTGDLDFLKGNSLKKIKLDFHYNSLKIRDKNESDFIQDQITRKNEASAGQGDLWAKNWSEKKINNWEPEFESYFNSVFVDDSIKASMNEKLPEFIMTVSIISLDPGYFIGFIEEPASLKALIMFTKTDESNRPIAVLKIVYIESKGFSTNEMMRISDCYVNAGEKIAKFIFNEIK